MATISDIARAAGVSPAVVSRVINGDTNLRITAETRERVERSIAEFDYSPNAAARALRSARSGLIALVVHDVTNPVYGEVMKGAQAAAARNGGALLISDASGLDQRDARLVELIGGKGVDGLILQADGGISDLVLARAARKNVPVVLLQAGLDVPAQLLMLPDLEAAAIATRHLVDLGHREIGCIATESILSFTQRRLRGWRETLASAGFTAGDDRIVHCQTSVEDGRHAIHALLQSAPEVTAVVCLNIVTALGVLTGIEASGRNVPDDISVVAIHNLDLADLLRVPLTTVSMPLYEMGVKAVELIHQDVFEVGGESTIDSVPQLIVRASTAHRRG